MKRAHDPLRLDVAAFTSERASLTGLWPGDQLGRLAASQTPPQDLSAEPVTWGLSGERRPVAGSEDEIWLSLTGGSTVWLTCQRCLQPYRLPLQVATRLRFVRGEAQAEALDAEIEEDVLALPRLIDVRILVEDELLLALPLVPRHEACPQPLPMSAGELDEIELETASVKANPFAMLASLKRGTPSDG